MFSYDNHGVRAPNLPAPIFDIFLFFTGLNFKTTIAWSPHHLQVRHLYLSMVIFLRLPRLYQRNIYPGELWLTHNNAKLTLDLIPFQREIDWIQQLDIY